MEGQFDQIPPDLIRHQVVYVDTSEYVHAFAFNTERAPYVVKRASDDAQLDVPIRVGTRTRSAHRHELVNMLLPAVRVPSAEIRAASLHVAWRAAAPASDTAQAQQPSSPESLSVSGSIELFVEVLGPGHATLPRHGMSAAVRIGSETVSLTLNYSGMIDDSKPESQFGVNARHDTIVVTGPGAIQGNLYRVSPIELRSTVDATESVELDLKFDVVGAAYPIRLSTSLGSHPLKDWQMPQDDVYFKHFVRTAAIEPH